MVEQVALELRGRHLEAANLDELLDTVDDEYLLPLVEVDLVPGAYPAVEERFLRTKYGVIAYSAFEWKWNGGDGGGGALTLPCC